MSKFFLEHIKISSFGAFSGKVVGPFSPHLNVVYGRNEAGKSTLAAFVGGVCLAGKMPEATAIRTSPATPSGQVLSFS